ncbi:DUF3253 domain-containing protein [Xanthobacter sp. TB0139]|uniref:DUF3253 domain-containing protein n=1 Tax=Xanthobacter sp. TB0139 TaxID=3459178 RepID=UPI00403984E0
MDTPDSPTPSTADSANVEQAILQLAAACPPGRTLAPMDVAQAVAPGENWQHVLPEVRRVAVAMAQAGRLLIYRKGKVIDPAQFRGVYRLGLPRND